MHALMYGRDRWDIWEGSLGHMGGIVGTYEKDHWDIWEGSLGRMGGIVGTFGGGKRKGEHSLSSAFLCYVVFQLWQCHMT